MTHRPVTIFDDYTAVCVQPTRLSDGSIAHNVIFGSVTLHAVTKQDAIDLAQKIEAAIEQHTVDEAQAIFSSAIVNA